MKKQAIYTNDEIFYLAEKISKKINIPTSEMEAFLEHIKISLMRTEFRFYEQKLREIIANKRRKIKNDKLFDTLYTFLYKTEKNDIPLWINYEDTVTNKNIINFFISWRLEINK